MKEFQSEAQRHAHPAQRYAAAAAPHATAAGGGDAHMMGTSLGRSHVPTGPSGGGARERSVDSMNQGVRNMSIGEGGPVDGNGYRAAMPPAHDQRSIDPKTGQLLRANSFH